MENTSDSWDHLNILDTVVQNLGISPVIPVPVVLGDMNQDGNLTAADSPLFVEALVDPTAYTAHGYSFSADEVGDVNQYGTLDLGDIQPFVDLFAVPANSNAVPEPSAFLLALLALAGVAGWRRV